MTPTLSASSPSACKGVLEKCLTPPTLLETAILQHLRFSTMTTSWQVKTDLTKQINVHEPVGISNPFVVRLNPRKTGIRHTQDHEFLRKEAGSERVPTCNSLSHRAS